MTLHETLLEARARPTVAAAAGAAWQRLGQPGTWWDGNQRRAIAVEALRALDCEGCGARAQALSPASVDARHTGSGPLETTTVDAVHRVSVDASRLTATWAHEIEDEGITPPHLVELIAIVATTRALETLCRGVGAHWPDLPAVETGEPTRDLPSGAMVHTAWVPTVPPDRATGASGELLRRRRSTLPPGLAEAMAGKVGNVVLALTLVPEEHVAWHSVGRALYHAEETALTPAQRELVATTTSVFNDCFYCSSTHLLRLEASEEELDPSVVVTSDERADSGVEHGQALRRFSMATLRSDQAALPEARRAVADALGEEAVSDAAAITAYFNGMNRIADATGTEINPEITPPDAVLDHLPAARRRAHD